MNFLLAPIKNNENSNEGLSLATYSNNDDYIHLRRWRYSQTVVDNYQAIWLIDISSPATI